MANASKAGKISLEFRPIQIPRIALTKLVDIHRNGKCRQGAISQGIGKLANNITNLIASVLNSFGFQTHTWSEG